MTVFSFCERILSVSNFSTPCTQPLTRPFTLASLSTSRALQRAKSEIKPLTVTAVSERLATLSLPSAALANATTDPSPTLVHPRRLIICS